MTAKEIGTPINLLKSLDETVVGFKTDGGTQRHLAHYATDPTTGAPVGLVGPSGSEFIVVSEDAPSDADGRPDGTIYFHIQP